MSRGRDRRGVGHVPCVSHHRSPLAVRRRGLALGCLHPGIEKPPGHPPPGACVGGHLPAYAIRGYAEPPPMSVSWPLSCASPPTKLVGERWARRRRTGGEGVGIEHPRSWRRTPALQRPLAPLGGAAAHRAERLGGEPPRPPGSPPAHHGRSRRGRRDRPAARLHPATTKRLQADPRGAGARVMPRRLTTLGRGYGSVPAGRWLGRRRSTTAGRACRRCACGTSPPRLGVPRTRRRFGGWMCTCRLGRWGIPGQRGAPPL